MPEPDCPQTEATKIAVLEARIQHLKENIAHQAIEYARRLDELNHAHSQASSDKAKFLMAELFYSKWDELVKWRTEFDAWRAKVIGIAIGLGTIGGIVGAIIVKVLP